MVDASAQDGYVAVAVEDGVILYENIIWDSVGIECIEGVIGIELFEMHLAVSGKVAHEIDVFQIAHHVEMTIAPGFYLIHETAAEILKEFHAGALSINTQVDIVALRRDVSVDECLMLRTIIGNCMNVNLFEHFVEVNSSMEHTERTVFESKLLYIQLGVGIRVVEQTLYYRLARSLAGEIYRMEIDEVQHVCYIYIL